jgi:hypothetical protein
MGVATREAKDWDGNILATSRAVKAILNLTIGTSRLVVMSMPLGGFTKPWNPTDAPEAPSLLHEYITSGKMQTKIDIVLKKLEPRYNK